MEPAPLRHRAVIRIGGNDAELVLNGDLSWACGDAALEDRLNEYFRLIDGDYQPDPVRFLVEATAKHFDGEIVSIPPPRKMKADPNTVY